MNDALRALSRDDLQELLVIYAKNLIALDGTWFQSLEQDDGMDAAMHHDVEAWRALQQKRGAAQSKASSVWKSVGTRGPCPRAALALPVGSQRRRAFLRRGRCACLPHHRLPRAERARAQGHGIPPVQTRRHRGASRVRARHRRAHTMRVLELLSRGDGRHLQLLLALHPASVTAKTRNGRTPRGCRPLRFLVGPAGLEPATKGL